MLMGSQLWFFFRFSIFTHLALTVAQDDFWWYVCINRVNYTRDSPYQHNLGDVLYSLTATNNGYGFFNSSAGQGPDRANAVALCRGDTDPETCRRCVDDATRQLRKVCPVQREAAGWYNQCLLNYGNKSLLRTVDDDAKTQCFYNPNSVRSQVQFNESLVNLFDQLRPEASGGGSLRKYASRNMSQLNDSTIYGFMQCTPDLSESQCNRCLLARTEFLLNCAYGKIGGGVFQASCNVAYGVVRIYNETWYPPTPASPSPGSSLAPTPERKKGKKSNVALSVGPALGAIVMIAILIFFIHKIRRKGRDVLAKQQNSNVNLDESIKHTRDEDDTGEVNYFSLTTLQAATNDFAHENKLGEGGFGPVYRGTLHDGKEIAVKRLSHNSGQGLVEFKTEVKLIIKLQHKNLVTLLGCCIKENERLLVYEYMANNSLDVFLFNPQRYKELDWAKRANIVSGIAKGLRYLHEDSRLKIVHRDMKASNVLLDSEMNPKISDFGTARIFGVNQVDANTNRIVGTYGYMAPEYAMEGLFSTKSDVYSFGVLLLEIISGQRNGRLYFQENDDSLLSRAWKLWKAGEAVQLIDSNVINSCPVSEALRWVRIALLCVQEDPNDRPTMSSVVFMLEDQSKHLPKPPEPPLSIARFLNSNELLTTGKGTSFQLSDQISTSTSS